MKPEELNFLIQTGSLSIIIITAIFIVRFILPFITKETKMEITELKNSVDDIITEMKELIKEMRLANNQQSRLEERLNAVERDIKDIKGRIK